MSALTEMRIALQRGELLKTVKNNLGSRGATRGGSTPLSRTIPQKEPRRGGCIYPASAPFMSGSLVGRDSSPAEPRKSTSRALNEPFCRVQINPINGCLISLAIF
jgi:hypothetical protein